MPRFLSTEQLKREDSFGEKQNHGTGEYAELMLMVW